MALLFHIDGYKVTPYPEALLISPFKEIWERDTSKSKTRAYKDFAYIEFMGSLMKSNPFHQYPKEEKERLIKNRVIRDSKYKPDKLVLDGIKFLQDMQTNGSNAYRLLQQSYAQLDKLEKFLQKIDLNEKTKAGYYVWKPKDIYEHLGKLKGAFEGLKELEDALFKEITDAYKVRGGKAISYFSNPKNLEV